MAARASVPSRTVPRATKDANDAFSTAAASDAWSQTVFASRNRTVVANVTVAARHVITKDGRGLCRTHGGGQPCSYPLCTKSVQRDGFCAKHGEKRICSVPGCGKTDRGGGLCNNHRKDRICSVESCTRSVAKTAFVGPKVNMCVEHLSSLGQHQSS
ncbi:unnamed protein product [Aphanomyces euteiches]